MFARLEEFESLTPLMITPCSTIQTSQFLAPKPFVSIKKEEASPPPRRNITGRTIIVPLTGNNHYRIGWFLIF